MIAASEPTAYELGSEPLWLYCAASYRGGIVRKLENLFSIYNLGYWMGELRTLLRERKVMDSDIAAQCLHCARGLAYLIRGEALSLTRSTEAATRLKLSISVMIEGDPRIGGLKQAYGEQLNPYFTGAIRDDLDTFQIAMSEEMKLLPIFSADTKGNLSIDSLVNGASGGYAPAATSLMDDCIKREIDEAGRCLAFALATACGFHILRAVEISVKGYVLAATGKFPNPPQRSWGTYIIQLTDAGASSDLIDLLKILKTKRNPLMHPQDDLKTEEAIGIFCICQSVIETLVAEVHAKALDTKFTSALAALPTL